MIRAEIYQTFSFAACCPNIWFCLRTYTYACVCMCVSFYTFTVQSPSSNYFFEGRCWRQICFPLFLRDPKAKCANQSKVVYSSAKVPTADHVAPWPESNKAAGSTGEQNPSERAMNLSVYAIITAANEAADQALTTP